MAGFTGIKFSKEWLEYQLKLDNATRKIPIDIEKFAERLAKKVQQGIRRNIKKGGEGPSRRHPLTVLRRGHRRKELIDTGKMYNSLDVRREYKGWSVGWSNSIAVQAAWSAEFGVSIRVTDAMRKWFAAQGFPLKKATTIIRVPPRPIIEPALQELDEKHYIDLEAQDLFLGWFNA